MNSPEPGDVIVDVLDASNIMTCVSPSANHPPQYHRQARYVPKKNSARYLRDVTRTSSAMIDNVLIFQMRCAT